jgi:hypothetical protein
LAPHTPDLETMMSMEYWHHWEAVSMPKGILWNI